MPPADQPRRTQIIATIGPTSQAADVLLALARAGMDIARVNFSHASHAEVAETVATLRAVAPEVAILGDLQGRKLRVVALAQSLQLPNGARLRLAAAPGNTGPGVISAELEDTGTPPPGTRIAIGDGVIELEVQHADGGGIDTVVTRGGTLTSRAGIYIPDVGPQGPALTEQDHADLAYAVAQGLEWVALSFVRTARDVEEARLALYAAGGEGTQLMAKIERHSALEHLDAIAASADAVMVARGDLGVAVSVEQVPVWQHRILAAGQRAGKPVVVATEMLESMRTATRPTRAEASDVAHAVWDGAAGVLLSAETSIGERPAAVVEAMDRIIRAAEAEADVQGLARPMAFAPGRGQPEGARSPRLSA